MDGRMEKGSKVGEREGGEEKIQWNMCVHVAMVMMIYLHPLREVGVVLLMRMRGGGSSGE